MGINKSIVILAFLFIASTTFAQCNSPEKLPVFTLKNVEYYISKTFSSSDAKGKWLVLDFWTQGCVSCVKSFPKINELQQEFKNDVQFLLIGQNDKKRNKNIRTIYERFRKTYNLNLAIAYDSVLFEQLNIVAVPYVIIADPEGNVYAHTNGGEITRENLAALVANKKPVLKGTGWNEPVEPSWHYSMYNSAEDNVLFRSVLSDYKGEVILSGWNIERDVNKGWFHSERASLGQLYCIAYFGQANWRRGAPLYFSHWKYPVMEVTDTTPFNSNYESNLGLYNYSLNIPIQNATKEHLMHAMQRDLKNYFGYEVKEEVRTMPCWKLIASSSAKNLKTKSQNYEGEINAAGITAKRIQTTTILEFVENYTGEKLPFIDETNLGFIDISFNATMTDINDVRGALHKHGLLLEKGTKEFKVLIIREPLPASPNN